MLKYLLATLLLSTAAVAGPQGAPSAPPASAAFTPSSGAATAPRSAIPAATQKPQNIVPPQLHPQPAASRPSAPAAMSPGEKLANQQQAVPMPAAAVREQKEEAAPSRRTVTPRHTARSSHRSYAAVGNDYYSHRSYSSPYFDFRYQGDLAGAVNVLRQIQPDLSIIRKGEVAPASVDVDLSRTTMLEVVASLGEAIGDKASITFDGDHQRLKIAYFGKSDKENGGANTDTEAKRFQSGGTARPIFTGNGAIQYPYGLTQPTVTCSPLHACDIQLEAGEVTNNVIVGDTVRWLIAPARTGDGALAIQHVIVKPTENGLNTNLIVATNRRTYMVTLKSSSVRYDSVVSWYYPTDMVQKWNGEMITAQRKAEETAKRVITDMPAVGVDNLNLDGYKVKGDRKLPWYPVRVFDDGTHVYIQMPEQVKSSEAPALILEDEDGKSELVNYRVRNGKIAGLTATYYIVDKLFKKAALIVGVDDETGKVVIERGEH